MTPGAGQVEDGLPAVPSHTDTGGPHGGPPLVLIHALGADRAMWSSCIKSLATRWRCIVPNLAGAGASVPAPGERAPTFDGHVAAILRLCDTLALGRVVAVGCAVGSLVAAAFAARHPQRCAALIMVNPILRITPEAAENLAARAEAVRASGMSAVLSGVVERAFHGQPHDARRRDFVDRLAQHDPHGYAGLALSFRGVDLGPELSRIACPALLVPGGQDVVLPPWHAGELAAGIADARCAPVSEGAHFLPQQCPKALSERMVRFLERVQC